MDEKIIEVDFRQLHDEVKEEYDVLESTKPNEIEQILEAKNATLTISCDLVLTGISLPPHGQGYFRVRGVVSRIDGGFSKSVMISGPDLTPSGPNDRKKLTKKIEQIPPGEYRCGLYLMSYWKYGGRLKYSTYGKVEGIVTGSKSKELVATNGQRNPLYKEHVFSFRVTD